MAPLDWILRFCVSAGADTQHHLWSWRICVAQLSMGDVRPMGMGVAHFIYCSWLNLIKPAVWLSRSRARGISNREAACYESQYRVICNRLWLSASLHKHQGAFTFHGLVITVRHRPEAIVKTREPLILSRVGLRRALDTQQQALAPSLTIILASDVIHIEFVIKLLAYFLTQNWTTELLFISVWSRLLKVRLSGLADSTVLNV